jgi:hypothetical protein
VTGSVIHYLGPEGLAITKRGSVRHKDQADLGALRDERNRQGPGPSFSFDDLRDADADQPDDPDASS